MREARHTENGLRQQTAHPAGESSASGRLHRALEDIRSGSNYLLGWTSIAMTVLFLLIGLWPLTFSPTNNASWLSTTNGLHFPGAKTRSPFDPGGVAFTPEPLIVPASEPVQPGALTLEMELRPTHQPGGAKERILSLCDTEGRERFFIGQWSTELLLFVPTGKDLSRAAYREIDLSREFKARRTYFVTITSDPTETLAYMDGKLVKRLENVSLLLAHQTVAGERLFLGNSPNGLHAWAGDVFGLALYSRALAPRQLGESRPWWSRARSQPPPEITDLIALYDFSAGTGEQVDNILGASNTLLIPPHLQVRNPLLSTVDFKRDDENDMVVNFFGFIPYGFALAFWLIRRHRWRFYPAWGTATVAGGLVSLTIELAQVYLPMRVSSLMDLLTNISGALLGAWLASWLGTRMQRVASASMRGP